MKSNIVMSWSGSTFELTINRIWMVEWVGEWVKYKTGEQEREENIKDFDLKIVNVNKDEFIQPHLFTTKKGSFIRADRKYDLKQVIHSDSTWLKTSTQINHIHTYLIVASCPSPKIPLFREIMGSKSRRANTFEIKADRKYDLKQVIHSDSTWFKANFYSNQSHTYSPYRRQLPQS